MEVSAWLQGRGGDLMLESGEQVMEVGGGWSLIGYREDKPVGEKRHTHKKRHKICFTHVFLTVSSFCRLTDRKIGACRPQQSCSRA